jgi:hypothetical protein
MEIPRIKHLLNCDLDTLDPQHFMTGELLFNDVKAYSALGEHRTSGNADRDTSAWLAEQLTGLGFASKLLPFRVRQFQFQAARLLVNNRSIPCFPLWFPRATAPFHSTVAHGEIKGRVAIARLPAGGAMTPAHLAVLQPLIDAGASAIVAVTPSESGELVALNSPANAEPWPVPIVLAGPAEEINLRGAIDLGISIQGRDEARAEAFETVGEIGTGEKRIVISTPSSGWFHCAGERGPGIAIWLALARWASHRELKARYTFVASSGHELGEQGMHHFLASQAPAPDEINVWLHLGASIAARGSTRRLMTNRPEWLPVLSRNFASMADLRPEVTQTPVGELGQLAGLKYPCFGIAGGHTLFHSPSDLPSTTSAAMLEPVGQALLRTVAELESNL